MGPREETIDFGANVFNLFEGMFNNIEEWWDSNPYKPLYSCPSYPPVDIFVKKNKDLVFKFAVAGYEESAINLNFIDDYMIVKIEKEEENKKHYLWRGIRHSKVEERYYVPSSKYKEYDAEAKLKGGILTVMIPAKEEIKPKAIKITIS